MNSLTISLVLLAMLGAVGFLTVRGIIHAAKKDRFFQAVDSDDLNRVKQLADKNIVNVRDSIGGRTPLMHAAMHGRLEICRVLLSAGADPNVEDMKGYTALEYVEVALIPRPSAEKLQELGIQPPSETGSVNAVSQETFEQIKALLLRARGAKE